VRFVIARRLVPYALEFESAGGGFSLVWFIYNLSQLN
jgi:hypothetical protein